MALLDEDYRHLKHCVALAETALEQGNEPFGTVLVSSDGAVLAQDYNRVGNGDPTRHPELALAQWAATNMIAADRSAATVYTSGEHCPMCAAAHGWVGLGRIVYASSARQLAQWLGEFGVPSAPVAGLRIEEVIPGVAVSGPVAGLSDAIRELHWRCHQMMKN